MKPLFCILGASGSGKSTICKKLKEYGFNQIPSYTTRSPRYEGEEGHTFITDKEFDGLNNVVAYAETTGSRYCVTKEMLENEEYDLYVIDYTGLKSLRKKYNGDRKIVSVFIDCDDNERYLRLWNRYLTNNKQETMSKVNARMLHDKTEFKDAVKNCDYVFKNNFACNLEENVESIKELISGESDCKGINQEWESDDLSED